MDKFTERFIRDVDSHAIASRLEINKIISKDVAHTIERSGIVGGNKRLYIHLRSHADSDSISKLCDVMGTVAGYPRMSELGRAMKEELDLLTGKSSWIAMWSDPVFDSRMYSTMHCGVCAFMYLFMSVSQTHYMYLSTYSLHVLVYICTHYMYLCSAYAYAHSPQSWWGFSGLSPIVGFRETFPCVHVLHAEARTTISIL